MTHPPGTRLGSMRPGPTQPTRTGSHASAATHRQLEEAHLPRRSPHGKTEQGFPARETLTRGYSQRVSHESRFVFWTTCSSFSVQGGRGTTLGLIIK